MLQEVKNNNVALALTKLKSRLKKEGTFITLADRECFTSRNVAKRRKTARADKLRRKEATKRNQHDR